MFYNFFAEIQWEKTDNKRNAKAGFFNHSRYNHTGQQPDNNVPTGSIFQCSPLQEVPVSNLFTGTLIFIGVRTGDDLFVRFTLVEHHLKFNHLI